MAKKKQVEEAPAETEAQKVEFEEFADGANVFVVSKSLSAPTADSEDETRWVHLHEVIYEKKEFGENFYAFRDSHEAIAFIHTKKPKAIIKVIPYNPDNNVK